MTKHACPRSGLEDYFLYGITSNVPCNGRSLNTLFRFSLRSKMLIMGKILIIRNDHEMGDVSHHSRMSREKRDGALDEYEKSRYTVVGDLTIKAVEQAIEATASMHGLHFHLNPRTAHAERTKWAKQNFPEVAADLDIIWGVYGDLGYDGLNGKRAKEAIEAMERIMNGIENRTGLRFKQTR